MKKIYQLSILFLILNIISYSYAVDSGYNHGLTSDGTLGTVVTGDGDYIISGGTTKGTNLFHSFDLFNIHSQESATFTGDSSINNILSRVTGGKSSWINGEIKCDIENANMYFINSSGFMFGEEASLDIGGSIYFTTADYLKLGSDNDIFDQNTTTAELSTDPPTAFGFLDNNIAEISLNGYYASSLDKVHSQLQVNKGESISLIAGDISLNTAKLIAESGRINLVSIASAGEVNILEDSIELAGITGNGTITLEKNSQLNTFSSDEPGAIYIRSGSFVLKEESEIAAEGTDDGFGGLVDMEVDSGITFTDDSFIKVSGEKSGTVNIDAALLDIDEGEIVANSRGSETGSININTASLSLKDCTITVDGEEGSTGNSGDINIVSNSITFDSSNLNAVNRGTETGGTIKISTNSIVLLNESVISCDTRGTGNGGDIIIAGKDLEYAQNVNVIDSRIRAGTYDYDLESGHAGDAGSISIEANTLLINASGNVEDSSVGLVSISAGGGKSGDIIINTTGDTILSGNCLIEASALGEGDAGKIEINSKKGISLTQGAGIYNQSQGSELGDDSQKSGNSGSIDLNAEGLIYIGKNATISSSTTKSGENTGDAGDINLRANNITLMEGGKIQSESVGGGDSGNVSLIADEIIKISGMGTEGDASSIRTNSWGTGNIENAGNAGNIDISSITISLEEGGFVSSSSYGSGNGGKVSLYASEKIQLIGNDISGYASKIYTSSENTDLDKGIAGRAGDIELIAKYILFTDGGGVTARTLGAGDGGTIYIQGQDIEFIGGNPFGENSDGFGSGVFARSDGEGENAGKAGDLKIDAETLIIKDGALITNSTMGGGDGGSLELNITEELTISGKSEAVDSSNYLESQKDWFLNTGDTEQEHISGLYSRTENNQTYGGQAGEIKIETPSLKISDGAEISTSSSGGGKAGNISLLNIDDIELESGGSISSASNSESTLRIYTIENIEDADEIDANYGDVAKIQETDESYVYNGTGWQLLETTNSIQLHNDVEIYTAQNTEIRDKMQSNLIVTNGDVVEVPSEGNFLLYNGEWVELPENYTFSDIAEIKGETVKQGDVIKYIYEDESIQNFVFDGTIWDTIDADYTVTDILITSGLYSSNSIANVTDHENWQTESYIYNGDDLIDYIEAGDAGVISVENGDLVQMTDSQTSINTSSYGGGDAGNINLDIKTLQMDLSSSISSSSNSIKKGGDAGIINIAALDQIMTENSTISTSSYGGGNAGDINLNIERLQMNNRASISSSSNSQGDGGDAGTITIDATESIEMADSQTTINTSSEGHGNAGDIVIKTLNLSLITGALISSASNSICHGGDAGTINIVAEDTLTLLNLDTSINTSSFGTGKAGDIILQAKNLFIDQQASISSASKSIASITYYVDDIYERDALEGTVRPTDIVEVKDDGNGNTAMYVYTRLGWIQKDETHQIEVYSVDSYNELSSLDPQAGDVAKVKQVTDSYGISKSQMFIYTGETWTAVNTVNVYPVENISQLSSLDPVPGDVATVVENNSSTSYIFTYDGWVDFNWEDGTLKNYFVESIDELNKFSSIINAGDRANVIQEDGTALFYVYKDNAWSDPINVQDQIVSYIKNAGDAGYIQISAEESINIEGNATISTEAISGGGGKIKVDSDYSLSLLNGKITASVQKGFGAGGDITIGAKDNVILNHSVIEANAVEGDGGAIFIETDHYLQSVDSAVTATSERGNDGTVEIVSPEVDVFKGLVMLPTNYLDASNWVKTPCALRTTETVSRLIVEGRDAIPTSLQDWQPSPPLSLLGNDEDEKKEDLDKDKKKEKPSISMNR